MNFIDELSEIKFTKYNMILSVINKFSKRVTLLSDKDIHTAVNWTNIFLKELTDWEVSAAIISDCDRKFLSEF